MKRMWKVLGGALAAVLLLAVLAFAAGLWRFNQMVSRDVKALFAQQSAAEPVVVTEEMLAGLPAPIQRYLRASGVVGKPQPRAVRLRQEGLFRTGPDQKWMRMQANEYFTTNPPGLVWDATMYFNGLPLRVRDRYRAGQGSMLGKIGGLVPVIDGRGEGIDQGTMIRYLNEIGWFPAAFLNDYITFTPIDDGSAQVTFTDGGKSVSATVYIDAGGRMTNFVAERYQDASRSYHTWSTPSTAFAQFEGIRMASGGQAVWNMPEGDFAYGDITMVGLEYDVAEEY